MPVQNPAPRRIRSYPVCLTASLLILSLTMACGGSDPAEIHDRMLTLDSHLDTPMRVFRIPSDLSVRHDRASAAAGDLDFPRMREGGLDAAFFAVYVQQGALSEAGRAGAKRTASDMLDMMEGWKIRYAADMAFAHSPEDVRRIVGNGLRAVCIGMENGYPIGTDSTAVAAFHARGVRYITLCHSRNNDICDSSTDPAGPTWNGLSPFGESVVREMNRLGMLVDVSHVSDSAFYDALRISRAPVIASHSCCRALMDNPRNLTDDMLRDLAARGGVAQINLCSFYLIRTEPPAGRRAAMDSLKRIYGEWDRVPPSKRTEYEEARAAVDRRYPVPKASVSDLADHIDHAVRVAGIDHVGIGSDFDGGAGLSDCPDVSGFPAVTAELIRRGYSKKDLAAIWGGNFMRVWGEAVRAASK
ncbi:dipeptidase [bacterium]|nr:dipeptidase [bacterium]